MLLACNPPIPCCHPAHLLGCGPLPLQDVVEGQLLREVAARSSSFFRAASSLQHLRGVLTNTIEGVRSLRQQVMRAGPLAVGAELGG